MDLLRALAVVDNDGDWAHVEIETGPIDTLPVVPDEPSEPVTRWEGIPVTKVVADAVTDALRIARHHRLGGVGPGLVAISLFLQPGSGACISLMRRTASSRASLLQRLQRDLLGTELQGLQDTVAHVKPVETPVRGGVAARTDQRLRDIVSVASILARGVTGPDRAYVVVTTAHVMTVLMDGSGFTWSSTFEDPRRLADYEAVLELRRTRPNETISPSESPLDTAVGGVRLTVQADAAFTTALDVSRSIAGSEPNELDAVLACCLLSEPGADARGDLSDEEIVSLRYVIMQQGLGAVIDGFDDAVRASVASRRPSSPTRNLADFGTGTFLGALLITLLGGAGFGTGLLVAAAARWAARRARRRPRSWHLVETGAALTLVVSLVLAATGLESVPESRRAAALLARGRAEIDKDDFVAAMQLVARASLYEPESVSAAVLRACIIWRLGFLDWALVEYQRALDLGFRPGEPSRFKGRGCFVDTGPLSAFGLMKAEIAGPRWQVYPRPDRVDSRGRRFLEIALQAARDKDPDALVALACLAHRYDMRGLASRHLTVGLNARYLLGFGATDYKEIRECLGAPSMAEGYGSTNDEHGRSVYVPKDLEARIPSPTKATPPVDACWARFLEKGPACYVD